MVLEAQEPLSPQDPALHRGLYRGFLSELLKGILGGWTMAHMGVPQSA